MNIVAFLNTLSDKEIAYFYNYRIEQYSKETQNEIKNYIFETRKLTENKISDLTKNPEIKTLNSCSRCGSTKFFQYDVDYDPIDTKFLSPYGKKDWDDVVSLDFIKTSQKECLVCGKKIKNYKTTKRILFLIFLIVIGCVLRSIFR